MILYIALTRLLRVGNDHGFAKHLASDGKVEPHLRFARIVFNLIIIAR